MKNYLLVAVVLTGLLAVNARVLEVDTAEVQDITVEKTTSDYQPSEMDEMDSYFHEQSFQDPSAATIAAKYISKYPFFTNVFELKPSVMNLLDVSKTASGNLLLDRNLILTVQHYNILINKK